MHVARLARVSGPGTASATADPGPLRRADMAAEIEISVHVRTVCNDLSVLCPTKSASGLSALTHLTVSLTHRTSAPPLARGTGRGQYTRPVYTTHHTEERGPSEVRSPGDLRSQSAHHPNYTFDGHASKHD